ncbi:MAG: butyrate kinase [Peptostreptococcales bacterium]
MNYRLLIINPGSTSTKIAVYENENELFSDNIEHSKEDLSSFPDVMSQYEYRVEKIYDSLKSINLDMNTLSAIVSRGGILPPIEAGAYLINEQMIEDLKLPSAAHASNLGALIANSLSKSLGIPSLIYDAISSDEFTDVARITGFPEFDRHNVSHVLNAKAMARKYAESIGKAYEDVKVIVAHLGGGISISAHENGRIIDSESDDEGPFSPERSGAAPLLHIITLCYSGLYDKNTMMKKIRGLGGLKAHLGTSDCRKIEKMISEGDRKAELIYEAQVYQIAKGIGMLLPVMDKVDAIILTGGVAYSEYLTSRVKKMVERYANVVILPGENEMESLALGGLRVLRGEEKAQIYHHPTAKI